MRVVFDTNVLISAVVSDGLCRVLLNHTLHLHSLILSDFILHELREKVRGKFRFSPDRIATISSMILEEAVLVDAIPLEQPVCRDPDDDWILATALAGNADCLVTGDKDLLVLKEFQGIPILSPSEFAVSRTQL